MAYPGHDGYDGVYLYTLHYHFCPTLYHIIGMPIIFTLVYRSSWRWQRKAALNLLISWTCTLPFILYAWLSPEHTLMTVLSLKQDYTCRIYVSSGANTQSMRFFSYEIRHKQRILIPKTIFSDDESGGKNDDRFEAIYANHDTIIGIVRRANLSPSDQPGELIAMYHHPMNVTWWPYYLRSSDADPETLTQWKEAFTKLKLIAPDLPVPHDFSDTSVPSPDDKNLIGVGNTER